MTPPWRARLATTIAAWMAAFGVVTALLSVLGDELGSLPLAIRALIISGVVVTMMTTVVMPALSVAIGRSLGDSKRERSPAVSPRTGRR
jgi:antibiotic biosynthesis monooxygenase (ABM) superfamily enzyme